MRFSVIIPFYNVEPFLRKCIESVLCQSYQNYEIILVDDGSTDECGRIADVYAARNANVSVIHQKNSGLGSARNTGLDSATGEYIVFIDSDDWIEADYLEEANAIIESSKPDFIHFGWYEDRGEVIQYCYDENCTNADKNELLLRLLKDDINCQVWKNIYKDSLWNNLRFPKCLYEDLYITHKALNAAKKVVCTEKGFYHYLLRSGNISNTRNAYKGRDIFWGFASRYHFCIENHIGLDLFSKVCNNAIQAVHGLSEIQSAKEIKEVADYVLHCRSTFFSHVKAKIELFCARYMTSLYILGVKMFYRFTRRR